MQDSNFSVRDWSPQGLQFSCTGCHACCRHEEGYVFFGAEEMKKICDFLKISIPAFKQKYAREVSMNGTSRLSLRETPEHDCIFWDNGCSIYPARPLQCSSYPFWPQNLGSAANWEEEAQYCPGMNHGQLHSVEKITNILEKLETRKLLGR